VLYIFGLHQYTATSPEGKEDGGDDVMKCFACAVMNNKAMKKFSTAAKWF
jgi:hypothetical protein